MAIKLANVSDWKKLDGDKLVVLPGKPGEPRKIRFEVNCAQLTRFDLMRPGEDAFPLGTVSGYEVIEFWDAGDVRISAMSAVPGRELVDAWFFTADGQATHFEVADPVVFTRIAQRRARNPELELMQYMANLNMERRFKQQSDEFERRIAALGFNPDTGEVKDDGQKPKPKGAGAAAAAAEGEPDEPEAGGEGGGDDVGASAAGDGGTAGNGLGKRPKGAGRQVVPPAPEVRGPAEAGGPRGRAS